MVVGLLVSAGVVALRRIGLLEGALALVAVGALLVLVPTARTLSGRLLLTGALVLGSAPALWWVRLPPGEPGRVTVVLALVAGALAGCAAGARHPRNRLRRLLPEVRAIDALPVLAAAAAAWVQLPRLVADGGTMLAILVRGWDNSAHQAMIQAIRLNGATIDALGPAPGGEAWKFDDYPQGFHALAAGLAELVSPGMPETTTIALAQNGRAAAGVVVVALAMLAAGLCTLPALRSRPAVAAPVVTLVVAAHVLGPGSAALADGFANFPLVCILASCVPLVAVQADRVADPLRAAAVGALVVGVAHSWVLLLALALPAAALVLLPWRRERLRASRRAWVLTGAIVALAGLGCLRAAVILSALRPGEVLTTRGGISATPVALLTAATLASLALGVASRAAIRRSPGTGHDDVQERTSWVPLLAVPGVIVTVGIGVFQLVADGVLSYYEWKFMTGLALVACTLAAVGLAAFLGSTPEGPRPSRPVAAVVAALGALAATQVFGFTGFAKGPVDLPATAPGAADRAVLQALTPSASMLDVLAAAEAEIPPGRHGVYLTPDTPEVVHPASAQQWYLALRGEWTQEADRRGTVLLPSNFSYLTPEDGDELARGLRVLEQDDDAVLVVSPPRRAVLQDRLASELSRSDLAERVVSW